MPPDTLSFDRPFLIEHRRRQETPAGFVPDARLILTPALRTGGLLAQLSDEQARTLLALLTFLTPNGRLQATAWEVAEALALSNRQANKRLEHLTTLTWRGEPVVYQVSREVGLTVYALAAALVAQSEAPALALVTPAYPAPAGREAVLAFSRATYGRSRAEVEQVVEAQLGHPAQERADTPEGEVRRRLRALGVMADEVEDLLTRFSVEEIAQQLEWLPQRNARQPARYIVAAIRGHYAPPLRARLERALSTLPALDVAEPTGGPEPEIVAPVSEQEEQTVNLPIPEAGEGGEHG